MRAVFILASLLCIASPVMAATGKLSAFVEMCKSDLKKDTRDNKAIRDMKIDPAGLCVCVAVVLDRIVSDGELVALAGKPLPSDFLSKAEAARNYCTILIVDAAGSFNSKPATGSKTP
jgi:hypothetical protein